MNTILILAGIQSGDAELAPLRPCPCHRPGSRRRPSVRRTVHGTSRGHHHR